MSPVSAVGLVCVIFGIFSPSIPFYHDKLLFQFCPSVSNHGQKVVENFSRKYLINVGSKKEGHFISVKDFIVDSFFATVL